MRYKIAYITTLNRLRMKIGGALSHFQGVVGGMRNNGQDLFVIKPSGLSFSCEGVVTYSCPVSDASSLFMIASKYEMARAMLKYSSDIIRREKPDCIYQRHSLDCVGLELKLRFALPLILEYNGSEIWVQKNWGVMPYFLGGIGEQVERLNTRGADLIITCSDVLKKDLESRGIDPWKIEFIPNGVDINIFDRMRYIKDKPIIKRNIGLSEDDVVVGFFGTFGQWHGVEILSAAIRAILAKKNRLRFVLVGEGVFLQKVKGQLKDEISSAKVIITGVIAHEEVPPLMAACDILVMSHVPNPDGSPFFGSPIKLFEYMAIGGAIVASDLGQIGQILKSGETALLVTPCSVEELAGAILKLTDDPGLRERLGINARKEAVEKYSWDRHASRIIDTFERVCLKKA